MSNTLGWVVAVAVMYMACALSGGINMFLDMQTFIVILGFVYGLSLAVFGWQNTLASIIGVKYLFSNHTANNSELSNIYKTQIKFSFWAGFISLLISIVAIANNLDDLSFLGQALAVSVLSLVYPVIFSGLMYYPLYKKLA